MTFIASVIAKEGIAVVADSFVSTSDFSITDEAFFKYLAKEKPKKYVSLKKLFTLFDSHTASTRNYVEKLFEFDDFSAITTTGSAFINGKEINDLLGEVAKKMQKDKKAYAKKTIDEKLDEFSALLKTELVAHANNDKFGNFGGTRFIFSHYNVKEKKPQIFIIILKRFTKDKFDENDAELITRVDRTHLKIILAGQDSFADRLIFGSLYTNMNAIRPKIFNEITKAVKPRGETRKKLKDAIYHDDFLNDVVFKDVFSVELRELSLQEAADLAALLLKIVMELQVYTEKIPTVGGVIRLAVIHKETGFKWISGDKLTIPKFI